jgi:hypothetical protein
VSKKHWMFKSLSTLLLVTCPLLGAPRPGEKAGDVKKYVGQMVEATNLTESYVGIAKNHLDPKSDAYITAEKKYAVAYSKYGAWLAELEVAIRQGSTRHLDEDTDFQKRGKEAGDAAADFVSFVDSHTLQSKAVITVITDIATAALKIWQGIKDQQTKDRQNTISDLENHAKWKSWDELTSAPSKPDAPNKPPSKP